MMFLPVRMVVVEGTGQQSEQGLGGGMEATVMQMSLLFSSLIIKFIRTELELRVLASRNTHPRTISYTHYKIQAQIKSVTYDC